MADASRYSIIDRLSSTKLDLITARANLSDELKSKKQKVENLKKGLEDWNSDVEESIKVQRRQRQREIELAELEVKNSEERLTDRKVMYEEKIKELDKALVSIEKISESVGATNNN